MKNLITTLFLALAFLSSTISFANVEPATANLLIEENTFTLNMAEEDNLHFNSVYYCTIVEKVCFKAKAQIDMVQVIDSNDEIVMFLPIGAEVMHLSMDELSSGDYTINIILEGADKVVKTNVSKK